MCEAGLTTDPAGHHPTRVGEMALGDRVAICPPTPTPGLNLILLPLDATPRLGFRAAGGRREAEAGTSCRRNPAVPGNRAQTSGCSSPKYLSSAFSSCPLLSWVLSER